MITQDPYLVEENLKKIPFVEILLSYTESFSTISKLGLKTLVKSNLEQRLLEELSFEAEVTLQSELDEFVKKGNTDFDEFIDKMITSLPISYPVLDEILKIKTNNFVNHIHNIFIRFRKDSKNLESVFNLSNTRIVDINVSLGDGHNGEGTSLVILSNGTKLIYKPRNIGITTSYNSFVDWVNLKQKTDLKTFKVLDCENYGWIEFVSYEEVRSEKELREYYHKAGMLLAVTLLLGSKDCHHENVIASGKNPVLIDHETIIQPFFNDKSFRSWDDQFKIPLFSVLESVLIINKDTGAPLDIVGYGVKGNVEVTELEKKIINPNTINSKRITCFAIRKIVGKNIPTYSGEHIFASDYKKHFIKGFSSTYDMFINSKEELRSKFLSFELFKNNEVRYVWRPTFVYFKILKYMRAASFMSSYELYKSRLYDLLSKAFKGENKKIYKYILDFETSQMLNGDIPIFNLRSQDDFLLDSEEIKLFEYSCLENINHRINLLSENHKKQQLEYISKWLSIGIV